MKLGSKSGAQSRVKRWRRTENMLCRSVRWLVFIFCREWTGLLNKGMRRSRLLNIRRIRFSFSQNHIALVRSDMSNVKLITLHDILPFDEYAATRKDRKKALTQVKKNRRMEVGPHASFYFENYETMWHQMHEMLYIERGGEDQIPDELAAYNPLIPQGSELIATVMFEIGDPIRRANVLGSLGGIEETMFVSVDGKK